MNALRLEGLVIFVLFFGVAALDSFQTHNWIQAAFWIAIGIVFLLVGAVKPGSRRRRA
jgi:hypothetical protein